MSFSVNRVVTNFTAGKFMELNKDASRVHVGKSNCSYGKIALGTFRDSLSLERYEKNLQTMGIAQ